MSGGDRILAGLDLGAHAIKCVVVALSERGAVEIIGGATRPCVGIRDGDVVNEAEALGALRALTREVEEMANCEIEGVVVNLSGRWVEGFDTDGMVRIREGVVTEADLEALMDVARAVKLPPEVSILHTVPQRYTVDGQVSFEPPLGASGVRLLGDAHLLTGRQDVIERIRRLCAKARLKILDVVYAPLAQAELLLTPTARELGVILLSLGEDTTEVAIFQRGGLVHTGRFKVAGRHVTSDIKACLEISEEEAEALKHADGCALADAVEEGARVEIPGLAGRPSQRRPKRLLSEIIEARLEEIFKLIAEDLDRRGLLKVPGGVLLTGGGANLSHVDRLAEQVFGCYAALGAAPQQPDLGGLVDLISRHEYTASAGLALFGARDLSARYFSQQRPEPPRNLWKRLLSRGA